MTTSITLINSDSFDGVRANSDSFIGVQAQAGFFDAIITDIPYTISKSNQIKTMKDRSGRTGLDFGDWDKDFDVSKLKGFVPSIKKGGTFFTFHSFEQYLEVKTTLEGAGLCFKDNIIWNKTNPMPRNRDRRFVRDIELGSWFVKVGNKWTFNRQDTRPTSIWTKTDSDNYYREFFNWPTHSESCVFTLPSESGGGHKRWHSTQKNLQLVSHLIEVLTDKSDWILDPFAGGGTTAIACMNTKRNAVLYEKDTKTWLLAKERIDAHYDKLMKLGDDDPTNFKITYNKGV